MLVGNRAECPRTLAHLGDYLLRPDSICRQAFNDRRLLAAHKKRPKQVHCCGRWLCTSRSYLPASFLLSNIYRTQSLNLFTAAATNWINLIASRASMIELLIFNAMRVASLEKPFAFRIAGVTRVQTPRNKSETWADRRLRVESWISWTI